MIKLTALIFQVFELYKLNGDGKTTQREKKISENKETNTRISDLYTIFHFKHNSI